MTTKMAACQFGFPESDAVVVMNPNHVVNVLVIMMRRSVIQTVDYCEIILQSNITLVIVFMVT